MKLSLRTKLIALSIGLGLMFIGLFFGAALTMDNPMKAVCLYTILTGELIAVFCLPSLFFHTEK